MGSFFKHRHTMIRTGLAFILGMAAVCPFLPSSTERSHSPSSLSQLPSAAAATSSTSWVAAENAKAGTTKWKIDQSSMATDDQLSAYATQHTVAPGGSFDLKISSTVAKKASLQAYRVGWYGGKGARLVATQNGVPVKNNDTITKCIKALPKKLSSCKTTWSKVAGAKDPMSFSVSAKNWASSGTFSTKNWPSGNYLIKLTVESGGKHLSAYVPLVVRSTSFTGKTTVINATTTWQAYNTWGGYSAYYGQGKASQRSRVVSFDRPYSYVSTPNSGGPWSYMRFERASVVEAERLGLNLAYATSEDLHSRGTDMASSTALVFLGHDEYWSNQEQANATAIRDRGTNLLFSGANTMWWRIRFSPDMRSMTIYKDANEDPVGKITEKTINFPTAGPSSMPRLLGSFYVSAGAIGDLTVTDPTMFLFKGTNARKGQKFQGLLLTEVDRVADRPTDNPSTLQIGARSLAHDVVKSSKVSWSDLSYYSTNSGSGVINFGSMGFNQAMDEQFPFAAANTFTSTSRAFARTVFDNALTEVSTPKLGQRRPGNGNWKSVLSTSVIPSAPSPRPKATNALGDASGDGIADMWSVSDDGTLWWHKTAGRRTTSGVQAGHGWKTITSLNQVADLNGDGRSDLMARRSNGELWSYYSYGNGRINTGEQIGHGWNGMSIIAPVGHLSGSPKQYVVAREDSTGDLYRYEFASRRLTGKTKIGHGWGKARFIFSVGDVTGDKRGDLAMIAKDGTLWLYPGTAAGTLSPGVQTGHGWSSFTLAFSPGNIAGSPAPDLVGLRTDGKVMEYDSRGVWWGKPVEMGHGFNNRRLMA